MTMRKWYRRGFHSGGGRDVPLWVDAQGNRLYKDGKLYSLLDATDTIHKLKSHIISEAKKEVEKYLK